ncbi:MAG: hypothetical protein V2G42_06435 [bacterium JZ-2024 1]
MLKEMPGAPEAIPTNDVTRNRGTAGALPKVKVLATSPEHLGVFGECEYSLDVLRVPSSTDPLDIFLKSPAVLMFVDRAVRWLRPISP